MTNDTVILRAKNITKRFPGVIALNKVKFELKQGDVHALCGENGAGKSTLLKIITGLFQKDEGEIHINDKKVEINNIADAREHGIYVVPQEMQMDSDLTVAENVFIGNYPTTKLGLIDWKTMYARANELKKRLGISDKELNVKSKVGNLSMGHKQIIEIMRSMISDKVRILAFDEPTSSLSEDETEHLFGLIRDLKEKGISIIYVSHRLEEIFRICNKVTVYKDGEYVDTRNVDEIEINDIIHMMVGRDLNLFGEKKDPSVIKDEVVLKLENYTRKGAFENISLELKRGEILGLYGLVGSGRTELMRAMFGIDKKETGTTYLYGKKVNIKSAKVATEHGLGFVTEDRRKEGLLLDASLTWNLSMPNIKAILNRIGLLNFKKEASYAKKNAKKYNVKCPSIKSKVSGLSGGNQQKVVIAKWVAASCDIIIFDEPTRGIDVGAKAEIFIQMKELTQMGKSIIMISSELPEILGLSDRILVFKDHKINAILENIKLNEEDVLKYAMLN